MSARFLERGPRSSSVQGLLLEERPVQDSLRESVKVEEQDPLSAIKGDYVL